MKTKKLLMLIVPVFAAISMFFALNSFTTASAPFKVSCQFSPTTSDFVNVEMENCNNLLVSNSVAAGTSWAPSLVTANCSTVYITSGVPVNHPAGTISIYRNGALVASHTVAQNQPASFFDVLAASPGDRFLVTW